MNDNTILRIKVPAHLYESVKEQLTINEAKKSGKSFGDWTVVKEKKMTVPKDGMKKVEEADLEAEPSGNAGESKDSVEKALASSQVNSAIKVLNAAITDKAKFAKAISSIIDKLSSGEGEAFDNTIKGNSNFNIAKDKIGAIAGAKDKEEELEESDKEDLKENEMNKSRTLDELKSAKDKLDKKIQEMEGTDEQLNEFDPGWVGLNPALYNITTYMGLALPMLVALLSIAQQKYGPKVVNAIKAAIQKKKEAGEQ